MQNSMKKIIGVTLFAVCSLAINAIPEQLVFIRHGEKPHNENDINLNGRGFARSYALVPLFVNMSLVEGGALPKDAENNGTSTTLPAAYGQPTALYAKAQKHAHNAVRAIKTLEPISQKLSLEIIHHVLEDDSCDKKDPKKYEHCYMPLFQEIMNNSAYDGKIVLICWEHNAIPTMLQAVVTMYSEDVELHDDLKNPQIFKKFDRILRVTFKKGVLKSIDNLAQELLYGDSASSTNRFYKIKGKKMIEIKKD
jgi:hypothetical protein